MFAHQEESMKQAIIQENLSLCSEECTTEEAKHRSRNVFDCLLDCYYLFEEGGKIEGERL